jgi:uncharacterized membrane protein (UPF0127 family)
MEKISIKIADKTYIVSVARTDEEKEKGLMGVETLPENEGMLFDYTDDPQTEISFWMKDTLIPLDIIFINNQGIVAAITQGEPESEEAIVCEADENELLFYVLEVNSGSGIKEGDRFEMSQEEAEELGMVDENGQPLDEVSDEDLDKMFLLDPDGNKIALIEGGSRIFSRKNTRVMVRLAKQANRTKSDSDYKKLGKTVFKFLDIQDSNEAEYVDAPTGKSEN